MSEKKDKDLIEKTIASEVSYNGSFLKVHRDKVKTPSGKITQREFVKHPGASLIIPQLPNGKFLLIRQFRYSVGKIFLEFPAGKIDRGEVPEQTAHRELKEEVGYISQDLIYVTSIHPVIGYSDEVIHIYLAKNLTFVGDSPDPDEVMIPIEMTLNELILAVHDGNVTDVKTQIAIFWADKIFNQNWTTKDRPVQSLG